MSFLSVEMLAGQAGPLAAHSGNVMTRVDVAPSIGKREEPQELIHFCASACFQFRAWRNEGRRRQVGIWDGPPKTGAVTALKVGAGGTNGGPHVGGSGCIANNPASQYRIGMAVQKDCSVSWDGKSQLRQGSALGLPQPHMVRA